MITIVYEFGDVSLLSACAAAKQLIAYSPAGTQCQVRSVSNRLTLVIVFTVDANGLVSEKIDVLRHADPQLLAS